MSKLLRHRVAQVLQPGQGFVVRVGLRSCRRSLRPAFKDGGRVEAGGVQLFEWVEKEHGGPGADCDVYEKPNFIHVSQHLYRKRRF